MVATIKSAASGKKQACSQLSSMSFGLRCRRNPADLGASPDSLPYDFLGDGQIVLDVICRTDLTDGDFGGSRHGANSGGEQPAMR